MSAEAKSLKFLAEERMRLVNDNIARSLHLTNKAGDMEQAAAKLDYEASSLELEWKDAPAPPPSELLREAIGKLHEAYHLRDMAAKDDITALMLLLENHDIKMEAEAMMECWRRGETNPPF
jgi:hypothetical protein